MMPDRLSVCWWEGIEVYGGGAGGEGKMVGRKGGTSQSDLQETGRVGGGGNFMVA